MRTLVYGASGVWQEHWASWEPCSAVAPALWQPHLVACSLHSHWHHPRPGLFISVLDCRHSWPLGLWAIFPPHFFRAKLTDSSSPNTSSALSFPYWKTSNGSRLPPKSGCLVSQMWPFRFMSVNMVFLSRQCVSGFSRAPLICVKHSSCWKCQHHP